MQVELWDQIKRRIADVPPQYYRGADACIMVYDVTSEKSFNALQHWLDHFIEHTQLRLAQFPVAVVGTKYDLKNQVTEQESGLALMDLGGLRPRTLLVSFVSQ